MPQLTAIDVLVWQTKALGLGKSRKQTRPPMIHTSLSHASLFSPSADDLSGSPRSAPPTRSTLPALRHSKSTSNFLALGRSWTRRHHHHQHQRRAHTADHVPGFSAPTTPHAHAHPHAGRGARHTIFGLARRSTSSSASSALSSTRTSSSSSTDASSSSTHYTTTRTANESIPHSPLPAQIWPRLTWDPSVDPEEIDLGLDGEDEHDNGPVFAQFFQRLRDIEAELDLIEARGHLHK
jgi:hypothetical protein